MELRYKICLKYALYGSRKSQKKKEGHMFSMNLLCTFDLYVVTYVLEIKLCISP
jgi:hypothetical protein